MTERRRAGIINPYPPDKRQQKQSGQRRFADAVAPDGFTVRTIPAFTWAVFPSTGALPTALQDVNTKIYTEWLPALREYEFATGYCVERYADPTKYPNGTADKHYYCKIWIPVKKK